MSSTIIIICGIMLFLIILFINFLIYVNRREKRAKNSLNSLYNEIIQNYKNSQETMSLKSNAIIHLKEGHLDDLDQYIKNYANTSSSCSKC